MVKLTTRHTTTTQWHYLYIYLRNTLDKTQLIEQENKRTKLEYIYKQNESQ